jgi:hypothetical protein
MSKKRASQREKRKSRSVRYKYRTLIAIGLLLGLSLMSGVLAHWKGLRTVTKLNAMVAAPAPTATPNSLAANNPAKEYIYAGGKLVATEEPTPAPTSTPTPTPSPSPSPTASPSPTPTPAFNGATFISQSVPTSMIAGQSYAVSLTMKNTGTTTWQSGTLHRLGTQNPTDNTTWMGANRVTLPSAITPDATCTFSFNVTAPSTPGSYNFQWRMVQDGVEWFGEMSANLPVNVVANVPPSISLTAPANAASFNAPANINLSASASDTDGTISKVEFFQGATKLGESTASPYGFAWNNVASGSYSLTARATDNYGAVTTSTPVNITVNALPSVSLAIPANNAVFTSGSNINLTATAADSDGTISKVEFFQGTTKLGEALSAPYSFNWTNAATGSYSLTARATDNLGGTSTSGLVNISVVPEMTSLSLNGTTSYVEVPNSTSLNITGPLTLEAWVKTNSSTGLQSIIHRGDAIGTGQFTYSLRLENGKVRFDLQQSSGAYTATYGNSAVSTGVWHHVAAVYDGNQMRVYLDGVLDGSQSFNWTPLNISSILRIGGEHNASPYSFNGLIDEARVCAEAIYTGNFNPQPNQLLTASTRALWKFNSQSAVDSSTNANHGTLAGSAGYSTSVPSVGSLSLNGTSAYAQIPNSASLNITGPVTVEAWVKTNSTANQSIAERYSGTDGGYALRIWQGKLTFLTIHDANNVDSISSTSNLTTNVWHHVAGVYDNQGGQLRVYLDGALEGYKASTFAPASGTSPLVIGANAAPAYYKFNGLIDEVRITADILYAGSFAPALNLRAVANTKGLWKFNDGSANDASGNGNHAVLNGGATYFTDVPAYASLSLNGTSAYAQIPNSASLNITGPVTVEAWVRTNAAGAFINRIVSRYSDTGGGYILDLHNDHARFIVLQNTNSLQLVEGISTLTPNSWYHLAGVADGAHLRVYVNGVQDGYTNLAAMPSTGTDPVQIGGTYQGQMYFPFNGLIDEVKITSAALYNAPFTPQPHLPLSADTKGLWRFDDQTINDASGNGNQGTVNGGLSFSTTAPTRTQGSVAWTNPSANLTVTGSSLSKQMTAGYGFDAGAVSTKAIVSGSGSVEFTASEVTTHRMCGLSNGDSNYNYPDIDFAIYLAPDPVACVYEAGTYRQCFDAYNVDDRFRVEVLNGRVYYSKNGVVFYISPTTTINYSLLVDTSLYNPGATVSNVTLSGALTP